MLEQYTDTSVLSQLQNEFILSQERTIQDLRAKNEHLQRELQQLQRAHNSILRDHSEAKAEYSSLREQIQQERDQCTSRHLHVGKMKEKYKSAQLAVLQLENLNAALERELGQYREKYQTLTREEVAKGRTLDMAVLNIREDYRKLQLLLELEKETNAELSDQAEHLRSQVAQLEGKLSSSETSNRQMRIANEAAYDELQLSLERILKKVESLELENNDLRTTNRHLVGENKQNIEMIEELSSRLKFITKKRVMEATRSPDSRREYASPRHN